MVDIEIGPGVAQISRDEIRRRFLIQVNVRGRDLAGFVGKLDAVFLNGIGVDNLSGSIPTLVFVMFQMTFACITVALVLGSVVEVPTRRQRWWR